MSEQLTEEELEKGKLTNLLTAGAMGLGLLSSSNVNADAGHVARYVNTLKNIPGVQVKNLNTDPNVNVANHDIHVGKFKINVRAVGGGDASYSDHRIDMHGPKQDTWSPSDSQDYENAKYIHTHLNDKLSALMQLKRSIDELGNMEELLKSCPRCGRKSANAGNPSGRCRRCLNKLAANKKKPGHWQRAQTKADDALRRQRGENGTAHKKSSGLGSRKSIVKQVQRAEKKTGQKLSPDRKNNGSGYAASNTRMVPEKLNRGRHTVDSKKLRAWRKRLKKNQIEYDELYTYLLAKAYERADTAMVELLEKSEPAQVELFIKAQEQIEEELISKLEQDMFKQEPNVSQWKRIPNTAPGYQGWHHPQHGSLSLDTTGGKYKVMHNDTVVGDYPNKEQMVEMTRRYMDYMGVK